MTSPLFYLLLIVPLVSLVLLALVLVRLSRIASSASLDVRIDALERQLERLERMLRDELARNREEAQVSARRAREESTSLVGTLGDSLLKRMSDIAGLQKNQLDIFAGQLKTMTASNEGRLDKLRETVEDRLRLIQEDNARKLEQMRATVDEKLHDTLEKRLGESFKLVSERLELVQRGLGEMQSLASGVGDLKKVLTNVKTRGTFGEVQLASLLEQILAPGQYETNVESKKGSGQRVEFALRLPGRDGTAEGVVWLPLDAKFPQ
jgi:DNA recombination protein RmuC